MRLRTDRASAWLRVPKRLVLVGALVAGFSCWAGPIGTPTLGAVVRETGLAWPMEMHRASIGDEIREYQRRDGNRLDTEAALAVLEAAQLSFAPSWMAENVAAVLRQTMSEEDGLAALAWSRTAAGRRVVAARTAAEHVPPWALGKASGELSGLSRERRGLIGEIVSRSRFAEVMASMVVHGAAGMLERMADPAVGTLTARATVRAADAGRTAIEGNAVRLGAAWYAAMFRSLGDADLRAYSDFLASPAGTRFSECVELAMRSAYFESAIQFVSGVQGVLRAGD